MADFTKVLHHKSNGYKRRTEGLDGKNTLAITMVKRALQMGIDADYLLVDSWYAKPQFFEDAKLLGIDTIARLPNNSRIWNFQGKHKTINAIHDGLKPQNAPLQAITAKSVIPISTMSFITKYLEESNWYSSPPIKNCWYLHLPIQPAQAKRLLTFTKNGGISNKAIKISESTLDLVKKKIVFTKR